MDYGTTSARICHIYLHLAELCCVVAPKGSALHHALRLTWYNNVSKRNLLLDVTRLLERLHNGLMPTGIDRVSLAYVQHYGVRARAVLSFRGHWTVLKQTDSERLFGWLNGASHTRSLIRRTFAQAFFSSWQATNIENSVLLHTSHSGMEYSRYTQSFLRKAVRPVFMVHDLIPMTHPEYCRPGIAEQHHRRIHFALQHASGLIANSEATLESLAAESRRADIPMPQNVVARLAPAKIVGRPDTASPISAPFFVVLGTIEARKNHWFLLHVWRSLVEQLGEKTPRLIIVGRRGWECENAIDMLERCDKLRGYIVEESQCSDERLFSYLQHARALLFPSFAEGYGMPLVEALAQRVPVIASDLSVFREIANQTPSYLDPLDGPGWIAAIKRYMDADDPVRNAQINRIEKYQVPTWAEHFEIVDRFIEELD